MCCDVLCCVMMCCVVLCCVVLHFVVSVHSRSCLSHTLVAGSRLYSARNEQESEATCGVGDSTRVSWSSRVVYLNI
jgi:hypothetical protein